MDRSSSYIARSDSCIKPGEFSDNVVIIEKEKSISNQNSASIRLVFSHKPASEVFQNPDLLAAAKRARSEIKKQLLASGLVSSSQLKDIMDITKYGLATSSRYGENSEKVLGSLNFHYLVKALKFETSQSRFETTVNKLDAGEKNHRAKRGTGMFRPITLNSQSKTAGNQASSTTSTTATTNTSPSTLALTESEEDFMFSTIPSDFDANTALPDNAPEKILLAAAQLVQCGEPPNPQRLAPSNQLLRN